VKTYLPHRAFCWPKSGQQLLKDYNVVMPLGGGARATIEEAGRWEALASAARDELVRLVPSHRD
jgi:hypothetical protein